MARSTVIAQPKSRRRATGLRHRIADLKSGISTFAQTVTRRFDLSVFFRANECVTLQDPKTKKFTIVLPELSLLEKPNMTFEEEQKAEEFVTVMWGFVWHECGHVTETDFEVGKKALDYGGKKCHRLWNVLEDLRIEYIQSKRYPGAKESLTFLNEYVYSDILQHMKAEQDPAKRPSMFTQLGYAIFLVGMYGKQDALNHPLWSELMRKPRRFAQRYSKAIRRVRKTENQDEVWELVKRIWNALKLENEPEEPKTEEEKQERRKLASQAAQPDEGEKDAADEEDYKNQPSFMLEQDPEKDEGTQETDAATLIQARLQEQQVQMRTVQPMDRPYLIYTTEYDAERVPKIESHMKLKFHREETQLRTLYGPIRRQLETKLRMKSLDLNAHGLVEGELDTNSLHRVAFGGRDVFKEQVKAPSLNDVVASLWFDTSDSMRGPKLELAKQATMIFASALESVNIPFEVVSYTTSHPNVGEGRWSLASPDVRELYARWGDLQLTKYKSFTERWSLVGPRLVENTSNMMNTFDGECVRLAAARLFGQRQEHKVLFIMNDGEPCPNVYAKTAQHRSYLKQTVEDVERQGVVVVAIGIQSARVSDYYKRSVVVNNVNDLPIVMTQQLTKILLG